jgi:hypothetical protein
MTRTFWLLAAMALARTDIQRLARPPWWAETGKPQRVCTLPRLSHLSTENDRTAPLADQAHAIAGSGPPTEDASFIKLRELSLRYVLPSRAATLLGSPMSVTIAGRNLATWTRYSGADPEVNDEPLNMLPRLDFAQTPLVRELVVRLDVGGTAP